jgi:plasmid stabilization system protein ParE
LQHFVAHEGCLRAAGGCRPFGNRRSEPQGFGSAVAAALETYIRATVARIAVMPESGQRLPERPAVRVVPLVRYPFKIFYTAAGETLTILHIRHAARRPWGE